METTAQKHSWTVKGIDPDGSIETLVTDPGAVIDSLRTRGRYAILLIGSLPHFVKLSRSADESPEEMVLERRGDLLIITRGTRGKAQEKLRTPYEVYEPRTSEGKLEEKAVVLIDERGNDIPLPI